MTIDYDARVRAIISQSWDNREIKDMPNSQSVALAGGAVDLEAAYFYADLANSSRMIESYDRRVAAKLLKCFLDASVNLIKAEVGKVVSFDGDRVLGVFVGNDAATRAARAALKLNYVQSEIIIPRFNQHYVSVQRSSLKISHCVGIDFGRVWIVRAGARGQNDLVSIGKPANFAAKLSDVRAGTYRTYISNEAYLRLDDGVRFGGNPRRNMWEAAHEEYVGTLQPVYRSTWRWKP
ncbi:adenylate/guanylate cyclase domain-containing protein [Pontivivens ytuae]|uniref:Adenylate/guanylate cyclase domain-containing protein n=1 Tax=Pontivivens ytuae TaxID=2789856 RepID=A0A7S9QDB1_9RHOB|nr:adenylate/guanylate cyclase domain-containing protein [Pontivivens ytuae]QPH53946.1 adenylate/guanylate cyclase domain-containing protein [Pontivivens ytuae]